MKRLFKPLALALLAFALLASPSWAAERFNLPAETMLDGNGDPLSGAKLYFYITGTSMPKDTFSDNALSSANANPVVADSAGRFGAIFLSPADYKAVLKTSADVTVVSMDPIHGTATAIALTSPFDTNSQQMQWSKGADVASAAALILGTDGNSYDITGTSPITSIATLKIGTVVKLHFDSALTFTHDATNLVLPGAANITTVAGDEMELVEYGTGTWRMTGFSRLTVGADVQGDIAYHDGSKYVRLGPGTSGQVLQTAGAAANPAWVTGGLLVQRKYAEYSTYSSHTTIFPADDTIPQKTEGEEILTLAITPKSTTNRLRIRAVLSMDANGSIIMAAALFQDSTANALAVAFARATASGDNSTIVVEHEMAAGTVSETTFKIRIGGHTGTVYVNGSSSNALYGAATKVTLIIDEITP